MSLAASFRRVVAPLCLVASAFSPLACGGEPPPSHEGVGTDKQPWDSQSGNPTHATHSYLTEYAVDHLSAEFPELTTYRATIVDGANRELHETPVSDPFEEELRQAADGTNWAANHPEVVWSRALDSYAAGDPGMAYWYVGVVLHYVEDMGVPAHAFHVIHQGSFSQRDNFELLGLQKWAPLYDALKTNPGYSAPSDYVLWSGAWTKENFQQAFPGVSYSLHFFPMSWLWTSSSMARFVREREGRTATAAKYALRAAVVALRASVPLRVDAARQLRFGGASALPGAARRRSLPR